MAVKPTPEAPNSPAFAKSFGDSVNANGGPCVDSGVGMSVYSRGTIQVGIEGLQSHPDEY